VVLLVSVAVAHVPHAVLAGAVIGDPWVAVYDEGETPVVYQSWDAGHTWSAVPAAPTVEALHGVARLEDGRVYIAGESRLWWTLDGQSWESQTLRSRPVAIAAAGSELVVGLEGAVLYGPPDALVLQTGAWMAVGGGGQPVWVSTDGAVFLGERVIEGPVEGGRVQSVRAVGSGVWLGTTDGEVWSWTEAEGWEACGELGLDPAHPQVAALADGWALGAEGSLRESTDDCASWRPVGSPYRVDFGGSGGAADVQEAVASFEVSGGEMLIAGWDGLVRGPEWVQERLLPPDFIRDLAVGVDGAVYAASLTGVMRSFDGGATWDAPHLGVGDANVQRLAVDPADPDGLAALINHELHLSEDRGRSYALVSAPYPSLAEVIWTDALWVTGGGSLAWWDGSDWTEVATGTRSTWQDGPAVCWAAGGITSCTEDLGATVTEREELDLVASAGPVGLQEQAILLDGVEVLVLEDDTFRHLSRLDDGAWFASTRGGAVWTSEDGAAWTALDLDLPVAPVRHTPVGATLLLSTYDGAFALRDGVAERFAAWQLVKSASGFDDCEGCTLVEDACASQGYLTRVEGSFAADLRGEVIRVVGARGSGVLEVDGVAAEGWEVEVPPGWHEVRVEGDLRFDHVEAVSAGAVLPIGVEPPADPCAEAEPAPEPACGCGEGKAGAVFPLATLLLWRRRRGGDGGGRVPVVSRRGMV